MHSVKGYKNYYIHKFMQLFASAWKSTNSEVLVLYYIEIKY